VNDTAARRAQTHPMFFATPSTKEHTMKRIATTALAALIVTLALASVASAHRSARTHADARLAAHAAKAPQKAAQRFLLRVGHHNVAY
jgi:tryptophan synthase alpha subunit